MYEGTILLVRHGPGRGRIPSYLEPALDRLAACAPELRARVRLHETGVAGGLFARKRPPLDDVRAVVFWLADPLRELYPDCYAEASEIAAAAAARGAHLVNPPDALSNSVKSVQARIWHTAGIPTPSHEPFRSRAELEAILDRHAYPLLIRADLLHTQQALHFCRTPEEARALPPAAIAYPGTVATYVDTRAGFRHGAPGTIWAALYHKKRAFVFGDAVRTNHVFFSERPIVSLHTSTYRSAWYGGRVCRSLAPLLAPLVVRLHARERACLEADYAYFAQPPPAAHVELLRRAAHALGQEFTAIDYSETADGGLVLWEANPHFALPPWRKAVLARARRLRERIASYHDSIAAFFARLLDPGEQRATSARLA